MVICANPFFMILYLTFKEGVSMAFKHWNTKLMESQFAVLKSRPISKMDPQWYSDMINLRAILYPQNTESLCFPQAATLREQLADDEEALQDYCDFLSDIGVFANEGRPINSIDECLVYSVGNITPDLLFEFMKDFFHQFDNEFGRVFESIYSERYNNLQFSDLRSITYHIPTFKYSYINITKNDTLEDFLNSIHEYTHAIVDRICYRDQWNSYPFSELVSLFMELIAADYMIEIYEDVEEDLNILQINSCKSLVVYAEHISIERDYFCACDERDEWKKVVSGIQSLSGKSKNYIKKLLNKSAREKLCYTVPYLTAIELYYIYKQDKKACIELLKYLMLLEKDNGYNEELKGIGITLNKHSGKWVNSLINTKKRF